jgi:dipeptidyl aminopeptidase/acylaminoacyl peptidase
MKNLITFLTLFLFANVSVTVGQSDLTVRKIMQDPKTWIGTSPSNVYWSEDGERIYFNWNPETNPSDSLYYVTPTDLQPKMVSAKDRAALPGRSNEYTKDKKRKLYTRNGDIFLLDLTSNTETQLTNTLDRESSARFSADEKKLLYQKSNNLYSFDLDSGALTQLTNFKNGKKKKEKAKSDQNQMIADEQMRINEILRQRKERREATKENREALSPDRPKEIYTGDYRVGQISMSGDGNFILYSLNFSPKGNTRTIVPNYVTESGYTEDITARTNVGNALSKREMWIYNIEKDTVYVVQTKELPGLDVYPEYYAEYEKNEELKEKPREVYTSGPWWSNDKSKVIVTFKSKDNKDRWITLLNLEDGSTSIVDHQRDEAWIGGPGVGWFSSEEIGWLPDDNKLWFKSEETGYAHLYAYDLAKKEKKALTSGKFEVYSPQVSDNGKHWYFTANADHPGVRHFYKMAIDGGKMNKITTMVGNNAVSLSPDESKIAYLYSYANKPGELYISDNKPLAKPQKVTSSLTEEFQKYPWRVPEFVTFKTRDNESVHARLYKPKKVKKGGPAVIFVHGAGYLQNAHKWWSSYFREYMFHNLLADHGYTVLDIDYRASSGYGRDSRTAIYRHMGGQDLDDQVDGAKYLVENHKVSKDKIGIYGGSYGGFITLMALFTEPDVFAAGAALRSVTDWAHYNHGYTSPILNTPVEDSLAYVRSSPIYHAEGLTKPLLILHGIIDTNVHFQDVVRLSQRLIELEKENWEMAVYPLEGHGFREPTSWADEYSRIFKLFETHLK